MRDVAKRLAEDVVEARRRALVETENLHEKYPCLPEEPAPGVAIVEVGLNGGSRVSRRCRTSWTVCALTRPRMRNRLRRRRGRCEHGRWSLVPRSCRQPKRSNASNPFLPRRVDDVLMSDLHLAEDGVFQELVARRDALVATGPGSNPELLTATERQLRGASERACCCE
ncbi:hypothetical protein C3747_345g30 [Trypanosoma cruzi]|uniref:Uncharacterized protein n=1 Tax=Trypanosoma cruzi TaxID=5693 RepID=A0A2V2V6P2_TRYCR|nr:hypothetical protein C3747_345g30 [Trypanosoma cruzi]